MAIGSDMGGLAVAALLAPDGEKVLLAWLALAHARWEDDPTLRLLSLPMPAMQHEIRLLQHRDRIALPAQAIAAALRG